VKHAGTITVVVSLAAAAASSVFVPQAWRWPAIGAALFVAIIVALRQVSAAIGRAAEKKFNGEE
jgi:hypothetical protein